ncbi:hypothetical protein [uncultured Campylobacter sp.]|uniref:hypothetical protein n=1 Tax=uncultured Campylobacter sp. TaxID=218934 RepID=UPI002610B4BC|nr:hypothetical protein [uncultured Campylobacter sp.]
MAKRKRSTKADAARVFRGEIGLDFEQNSTHSNRRWDLSVLEVVLEAVADEIARHPKQSSKQLQMSC